MVRMADPLLIFGYQATPCVGAPSVRQPASDQLDQPPACRCSRSHDPEACEKAPSVTVVLKCDALSATPR